MTTRQKQIKDKHGELVALLEEEFEEHACAIKQDKNYKPKTSVVGLVTLGFYERPEQKGLPVKASTYTTVGGEEDFFEHSIKNNWNEEIKKIVHNFICPTKDPFEALFARMKIRK